MGLLWTQITFSEDHDYPTVSFLFFSKDKIFYIFFFIFIFFQSEDVKHLLELLNDSPTDSQSELIISDLQTVLIYGFYILFSFF